MFFDTCALVLRYDKRRSSTHVRRIISDRRNSTYIADVTVLEFACSIATECRKKNLNAKRFDQINKKFFGDIADNKLIVRDTARKDVLRAYDLIRWVGVHRRRNLRSADALIATCCLELAHEMKEQVRFYTSDKKLFDVLGETSAFGSALDIMYIDPSY